MLTSTVWPWAMGFGLTLINAVVGIVTLGVTPVGGAVGHGVSCGAPTCSTFAFVVTKIDAVESNSKKINTVVTALVFVNISFSPLPALSSRFSFKPYQYVAQECKNLNSITLLINKRTQNPYNPKRTYRCI